jgi:CDP-glycerol glycerophosphotransferase (TagB/SpsB family)
MKKRLESLGELPEHERTVLLAPSWGESAILTRFGDKLIDALIDTGYKIIVRPHPQSFTSEKELMDRLMSKYNDTSKVEWNRDNDNFEVLRKSDILISDFSGVFYEFSLIFDKPIIYTDTKFDPRPYDACWIKEPLWTYSILPELGIELNEDNMSDIKDVIDRCIEAPSFKEGRDKARSETWAHIGEGTKRSVDFIMSKYNEVLNKYAAEEKRAAKESKRKDKRKHSMAMKGAK